MYYATVSGKRALIAYKVFFFFFFFAAAGENYKVRDDHLRLGHRFSMYKRILAFRQNLLPIPNDQLNYSNESESDISARLNKRILINV